MAVCVEKRTSCWPQCQYGSVCGEENFLLAPVPLWQCVWRRELLVGPSANMAVCVEKRELLVGPSANMAVCVEKREFLVGPSANMTVCGEERTSCRSQCQYDSVWRRENLLPHRDSNFEKPSP